MDAKTAPKKHASCDTCGESGKLRKCGGCGLAWYCSRECQVAAWQGHKADCKLWQQQTKEQQQQPQQQQQQAKEGRQGAAAAHSSSSSSSNPAAAAATTLRASTAMEAATASSAVAATTTATSSSAKSCEAAAGPSSSSTRRRRSTTSRTATTSSSRGLGAAAGSSSAAHPPPAAAAAAAAPDDDQEVKLPFKYHTKADPTKKDLESPLHFSVSELAVLGEVYPGLMYDGGECSINLDRYLMKKVKTWYIQYLYRRQMTPPAGSKEDHIPFFQALMNKEVLIVSAKLNEELGMGKVPIRRHGIDHGLAGAMSLMLEHGRKGIGKHPTGMPKIMIYEPEEYCDMRLIW